MKNLLFAAWKNSSQPKIGQFEYLNVNKIGPSYEYVEGKGNVPTKREYENITVSAKDVAPILITAFFEEKHLDLEFVLKPGSPIFGRVVDTDGNPLGDTLVRADDWQSSHRDSVRSLDWNTKTDNDGRFVWLHAPVDEIELKFSKNGYMSRQITKITPSDVEYEFVLNPKLRVNIQVVDAITKKAVTVFSFRRYEGGYISTRQEIKDKDGNFTTAFDDQSENFTIAFEATGYKPPKSRNISLGEQDVELVVEMNPDEGIDGMVVDAEGNPIEGVRVIIPKGVLHLDNMKYDVSRLRYHNDTVTDTVGSFHFDPVTGDKYSFLVLEENGYVYMHAEDFPEDGKLILQPYATVIGDYYKGNKPVANERIRVDYPNYHYYDHRNIAINYSVETDENGKFIFDKLIAGTVRILVNPYKKVDISAGETKEIYLGGDGLTVSGHLLNPDGKELNNDFGDCELTFQRTYDDLPIPQEEWSLPEDSDAMSYNDLIAWFAEFGNSEQGRNWLKEIEQKYGNLTGHHSFDVDYNGQFEVANVKPGNYLLSVKVRGWKDPDKYPRQSDYNNIIARASKVFVIPEYETLEDMDALVDLGVLQCRKTPLEIGMKGPGFEIKKLKGDGKIRLSDYRGKTVLVNFTNPALEAFEPEKVMGLQQVCEQAKTRGDITIINVAIEQIPWDYMREKMISQCTLPGIYGVAQFHNSKIYVDYELGELPTSVLIGSGGRILSKGPIDTELFEVLKGPIQ